MFSLRSWDSSVSRSSGFEAATHMMEPVHTTIKSVNQGQRYNLHQTQGYPVPSWHFHSQTQDLQQSVRYLFCLLFWNWNRNLYHNLVQTHSNGEELTFSGWSVSTRRYHLLHILHLELKNQVQDGGICDFSEAVEKCLRKFHWF